MAVEEQYNFAPSQFRLWLALHEVTHRLQFTAVPWLRDHFVGLITEMLGPLSGDPPASPRWSSGWPPRCGPATTRPARPGVVGMLATPEQRQALSKISGMMSLLEGHGDVTMDRAGAGEVPGAAHFSRVLHERRTQGPGLTKLMSKVLGLDAKMRQYAEGERFVESVEAAGGPALLARVWEGPEWLPTLEEIRDPGRLGGPSRWVRGRPPQLVCRPPDPVHLPATGHAGGVRRVGRRPTRSPCWCWPPPPAAR